MQNLQSSPHFKVIAGVIGVVAVVVIALFSGQSDQFKGFFMTQPLPITNSCDATCEQLQNDALTELSSILQAQKSDTSSFAQALQAVNSHCGCQGMMEVYVKGLGTDEDAARNALATAGFNCSSHKYKEVATCQKGTASKPDMYKPKGGFPSLDEPRGDTPSNPDDMDRCKKFVDNFLATGDEKQLMADVMEYDCTCEELRSQLMANGYTKQMVDDLIVRLNMGYCVDGDTPKTPTPTPTPKEMPRCKEFVDNFLATGNEMQLMADVVEYDCTCEELRSQFMANGYTKQMVDDLLVRLNMGYCVDGDTPKTPTPSTPKTGTTPGTPDVYDPGTGMIPSLDVPKSTKPSAPTVSLPGTPRLKAMTCDDLISDFYTKFHMYRDFGDPLHAQAALDLIVQMRAKNCGYCPQLDM